MSAEKSPAASSGYELQADRFAERYGAYNSFWQDVEARWQADDEENRLQLAPVSRTVTYGDTDGFDELTVSWKDGSAILVSYLGTEDEMWDFADGNPRVRGFRLEPDTSTPADPNSASRPLPQTAAAHLFAPAPAEGAGPLRCSVPKLMRRSL